MAQKHNDHYETLGILSSATHEEVKKAYRKKAMQWHPDKNSHRKEEAEHQFKRIGESYEVLSDPERRAFYDRYGPEGLTGSKAAEDHAPQRQYAFHSPHDIFAEFFRGQDPFSSFGDIFGHHDPFSSFDNDMDPWGNNYHRQRAQNSFFGSHMHPRHHVFGGNMFGHFGMRSGGGFGGFGEYGGYSGFDSQSPSYERQPATTSISLSFGSDGGSTSRQTTTRIVNGQRTTVTTVKDALGNITVTHQGPDGRQYTTINGTAQQPIEIEDDPPTSSRSGMQNQSIAGKINCL